MSIEVMKLALDALENTKKLEHLQDYGLRQEAIEALRTTIQQAEAQQPSSKEHLFELWWEAHMPNATQEQAWTAFTAAVASNGVGIAAQQPATAIACGIPGMAKTTCPYCEQGFAFEYAPPTTGEPVGQVSDLFPSVRNKLHAKGFDSDAPLYTHPAPIVPATGEPAVKASDVMMIRRLMNSGKLTPDTDEGWEEILKVFNHPAPSVPNIDAAARRLAERMDYPWEHMPEKGRASMREHAASIIEAAMLAAKEEPNV